MDSHLLGHAVQFHGPDLVRNIQQQDQQLPENVIDYLPQYREKDSEIRDFEFHQKIKSFIARKSDVLFEVVDRDDEESSTKIDEDDKYAKMPPLESFLGFSPQICRQHFYTSLERRDIVVGIVTSVIDSGLVITLLCMDNGKARDIDELKISAFCPAKELPRLFPHQSPIEGFQVKDKIRGVVLNVNQDTEKIILSMLDRTLSDDAPKIKLGLINEDDFPVHYRRKLHIRGLTFDELLHSILGFNNSGNVSCLLDLHNVSETASLMKGLHRMKIPDKEYAEQLRRYQSQKWAHQNVADGVNLFKLGRQVEAMQCLNKALQIDDKNVEALVARGALYANNESYNKAIEDFEMALDINHQHQNARKYLYETLLTLAKLAEDKSDYEQAERHYWKAQELEPNSVEVREFLRFMFVRRDRKEREATRRRSPRNLSPKHTDEHGSPGSDQLDVKWTKQTLKKLIHEDRKGSRDSRKRKRSYDSSPEEPHIRRSQEGREKHRDICMNPESTAEEARYQREEKEREKRRRMDDSPSQLFGIDHQASFLFGEDGNYRTSPPTSQRSKEQHYDSYNQGHSSRKYKEDERMPSKERESRDEQKRRQSEGRSRDTDNRRYSRSDERNKDERQKDRYGKERSTENLKRGSKESSSSSDSESSSSDSSSSSGSSSSSNSSSSSSSSPESLSRERQSVSHEKYGKVRQSDSHERYNKERHSPPKQPKSESKKRHEQGNVKKDTKKIIGEERHIHRESRGESRRKSSENVKSYSKYPCDDKSHSSLVKQGKVKEMKYSEERKSLGKDYQKSDSKIKHKDDKTQNYDRHRKLEINEGKLSESHVSPSRSTGSSSSRDQRRPRETKHKAAVGDQASKAENKQSNSERSSKDQSQQSVYEEQNLKDTLNSSSHIDSTEMPSLKLTKEMETGYLSYVVDEDIDSRKISERPTIELLLKSRWDSPSDEVYYKNIDDSSKSTTKRRSRFDEHSNPTSDGRKEKGKISQQVSAKSETKHFEGERKSSAILPNKKSVKKEKDIELQKSVAKHQPEDSKPKTKSHSAERQEKYQDSFSKVAQQQDFRQREAIPRREENEITEIRTLSSKMDSHQEEMLRTSPKGNVDKNHDYFMERSRFPSQESEERRDSREREGLRIHIRNDRYIGPNRELASEKIPGTANRSPTYSLGSSREEYPVSHRAITPETRESHERLSKSDSKIGKRSHEESFIKSSENASKRYKTSGKSSVHEKRSNSHDKRPSGDSRDRHHLISESKSRDKPSSSSQREKHNLPDLIQSAKVKGHDPHNVHSLSSSKKTCMSQDRSSERNRYPSKYKGDVRHETFKTDSKGRYERQGHRDHRSHFSKSDYHRYRRSHSSSSSDSYSSTDSSSSRDKSSARRRLNSPESSRLSKSNTKSSSEKNKSRRHRSPESVKQPVQNLKYKSKLFRGQEQTQKQIPVTKQEVSKTEDDLALTQMELFLNQLKEKKKEQLVASGKIKPM